MIRCAHPCGQSISASGSLLLKVASEANSPTPISLYGQEMDSSTAGLARMNMVLHDCPTAVIKQGNTLADPLFKEGDSLKTFDYVVANPPFSVKTWTDGVNTENDPYGRFEHFGIPPAKQGDYAFLLHIIRSMKSTGKGACILPHGVLFRGNAEASIRKKLIRKGYIKGIIGLPANLFYGTGIPACILVLDKQDAHTRKGIFMIDAAEGWIAETSRVIVKNKAEKSQDKGWVCDLIPKALIVNRYFAEKQKAIDAQQTELETLTASLTELEEEHGGEEGAFAELEKINKAEVTKRLKAIKGYASEEETILKQWQSIYNKIATLKKAIKEAESDLDTLAYEKYPTLSEDEVKSLLVDDKWLATLNTEILGEMDRISQSLTQRVKELAELTQRVDEMEAKVMQHLQTMGFMVNESSVTKKG